MKIILILIIGLSLHADLRMAVSDRNAYFDTYGLTSVTLFNKSTTEKYDVFIKRKTKCKKYTILGISNGKGVSESILIDCKD